MTYTNFEASYDTHRLIARKQYDEKYCIGWSFAGYGFDPNLTYDITFGDSTYADRTTTIVGNGVLDDFIAYVNLAYIDFRDNYSTAGSTVDLVIHKWLDAFYVTVPNSDYTPPTFQMTLVLGSPASSYLNLENLKDPEVDGIEGASPGYIVLVPYGPGRYEQMINNGLRAIEKDDEIIYQVLPKLIALRNGDYEGWCCPESIQWGNCGAFVPGEYTFSIDVDYGGSGATNYVGSGTPEYYDTVEQLLVPINAFLKSYSLEEYHLIAIGDRILMCNGSYEILGTGHPYFGLNPITTFELSITRHEGLNTIDAINPNTTFSTVYLQNLSYKDPNHNYGLYTDNIAKRIPVVDAIGSSILSDNYIQPITYEGVIDDVSEEPFVSNTFYLTPITFEDAQITGGRARLGHSTNVNSTWRIGIYEGDPRHTGNLLSIVDHYQLFFGSGASDPMDWRELFWSNNAQVSKYKKYWLVMVKGGAGPVETHRYPNHAGNHLLGSQRVGSEVQKIPYIEVPVPLGYNPVLDMLPDEIDITGYTIASDTNALMFPLIKIS